MRVLLINLYFKSIYYSYKVKHLFQLVFIILLFNAALSFAQSPSDSVSTLLCRKWKPGKVTAESGINASMATKKGDYVEYHKDGRFTGLEEGTSIEEQKWFLESGNVLVFVFKDGTRKQSRIDVLTKDKLILRVVIEMEVLHIEYKPFDK